MPTMSQKQRPDSDPLRPSHAHHHQHRTNNNRVSSSSTDSASTSKGRVANATTKSMPSLLPHSQPASLSDETATANVASTLLASSESSQQRRGFFARTRLSFSGFRTRRKRRSRRTVQATDNATVAGNDDSVTTTATARAKTITDDPIREALHRPMLRSRPVSIGAVVADVDHNVRTVRHATSASDVMTLCATDGAKALARPESGMDEMHDDDDNETMVKTRSLIDFTTSMVHKFRQIVSTGSCCVCRFVS